MAPSEVPGELLGGKYRLERVLARGRSAVVWEASHVVTGRTLAVKLFVDPVANLPRARERMLLEARVSSLAPHPNLLPIDDVLELGDGRAALVMERLVGESLRARIERQRFSIAELGPLFGPALEALERAHAAGLVHRDLKPDNLFVSAAPERLVVLDFGIAKFAGETALDLTSTGVSMGTPFYMAPEQLFGDDDVDSRADVWALGVVLFEALTGRRPTEANNLGQLLKLVSSRSIPRLEAAEIEEHAAVAALVNRMLDVRKENRPGLDEVRRVLAGENVPSAPRRRWPLAAAAVGVVVAAVSVFFLDTPSLRAHPLAIAARVAGTPVSADAGVAIGVSIEPSARPDDSRSSQRAATRHLAAVPSTRAAAAPSASVAPGAPPLHEHLPF